MRRALCVSSSLAVLLVASVALGSGDAHGTTKPFVAPRHHVPGRALLKLRDVDGHRLAWPRSTDRAALRALKDLSARTGVDVRLQRESVAGWVIVDVRRAGVTSVPDEDETLALIAQLQRDPAVAFAEEDRWYRAMTTPNDAGFPQQWDMQQMNAPAAWDITQGLSSQRIGIIDTGLVRSHEDVGARAVGGFDFISDPNQANDGGGRDADFNDPGDDCFSNNDTFHGTHVAGTIGAATNNGVGIAGINWNAGLVVVRALGCGGGSGSDIMEGAAWAAGIAINGVPSVGANKVSVMNLSLGSQGACQQFDQDVVNQIAAQGTIFVAAAGNDFGPVNSPANCNNVVAVAAHGPNRSGTSYSSFGSEIDVVAPGGEQQQGEQNGVLSSVGPASNNYAFFQGTSMAAPHVTGVISLMQARNATLTTSQVEGIFAATGPPFTDNHGIPKPLLLADAAVTAAGSATPPPPPPPPPPVDTDDAFEENDDVNGKARIHCGDTLALFAGVRDQDWFVVDTAGGALHATLAASTDVDLYVVQTDGQTILGKSETETGNEDVQLDVPAGDVLLVVNPFAPQTGTPATGAYTLTLTCTAAPNDPTDPPDPTDPTDPADPTDPGDPGVDPHASEDGFEDNDDKGNAAELFCGEAEQLTMRDEDWFLIPVREGDNLEVTTSGVLVHLQLVDGADHVMSDDPAIVRARNLPEGAYLLRVFQDGTPVVGTYNLAVHCAPDAVLPGVTASCASVDGVGAPALALLLLLRARRRRDEARAR